jgi:hypothetical protein
MISFVLLACDGSGGSSSSTTSTPSTSSVAAFTSWSATTANVPVAMTGGFSSSVDLVGNVSYCKDTILWGFIKRLHLHPGV